MLVPFFRENQLVVTEISAGKDHSLICTRCGGVYACGNNDFGQRGDGASLFTRDPVVCISHFQDQSLRVTQLIAASNRSLFCTADGGIFEAGRHDHGQFGRGIGDLQRSPAPIQYR